MPNPSDAVAIEFDGVVKRYHRMHRHRLGIKHALLHLPSFLREWRTSSSFTALDSLSLTIPRGEMVGVYGHNGSGKSTMLGLMAGVVHPSEGRITVRGRVSPLLELGAGFHAELSGRENVFLNATILGLRRSEIARRFDRIVEFAGLREFIDEPMRTYSSGMYARLAFSVAVHTDPEVLLIDEVLSVGDAEFQEKGRDKMREFHRAGVTIVLVTHNYGLIRDFCDRAVILQRGKSVAIGPPADVEGVALARSAADQPSPAIP